MSDLLWVVQNNLYNEYGYVRFMDSLHRLNCKYVVVKPIPFTNIILPGDFDSQTQNVEDAEDPIPDNSQPIIVMGATSLARISKARGWTPGTFLNDNFHYSKWVEGFGADNMLNPDSRIGPIKSFFGFQPNDSVFVRPTEDTKAISGTVMSPHDFADWVSQISIIPQEEFSPLHQNTEIVISSVKKIYTECRIFIVAGEPVTASMYKIGNRVIGNANVDQRYIKFAYELCQKWQPADAFVVDVADTPDGLKVIEVNNFNSSGFYEADTMALVDAIERMHAHPRPTYFRGILI